MSSQLPPPSRSRSIRNSTALTGRQERSLNHDATESIETTKQSADVRPTDASDSRGAQSPSRLPISRNSSNSSSSSLLRTVSLSGRNAKDGSMPPPSSRLITKLPGRSEPSRPPVTRSSVLDAEKRSFQRHSSISSRTSRAGSVSSNTDLTSSRQRPTSSSSAHGRTASITNKNVPERTLSKQADASAHRRNASSSLSQNPGNAPLPRPNPSKASRPMSMSSSPYHEKKSLSQIQQPSSRETRSSTITSNAPPKLRPRSMLLNDSTVLRPPTASPSTRETRSGTVTSNAPPNVRPKSMLLNDSTVLRPSIASPGLPDPRRPAFSTLQQHFSPNKNLGPKTQTAYYLAPPSPSKLPENKLICAETAKLQSELLQLHLLHRDSAGVRAEWEESARRKLGNKFEEVAGRHRQLVALEGKDQSQINALALKKWADSSGSAWNLENRTMILGEAITEVGNISEPGGKYGKVVRRFEKWCSKVQDIVATREGNPDSVEFIEELDVTWGRESDNLTRKLDALKEQLDGLGVHENDGSSLAQVVNGCRELTQGMLMELEVMRKIEQDVLLREEEWIRKRIDEVSDGDDDDVHGAIWRR